MARIFLVSLVMKLLMIHIFYFFWKYFLSINCLLQMENKIHKKKSIFDGVYFLAFFRFGVFVDLLYVIKFSNALFHTFYNWCIFPILTNVLLIILLICVYIWFSSKNFMFTWNLNNTTSSKNQFNSEIAFQIYSNNSMKKLKIFKLYSCNFLYSTLLLGVAARGAPKKAHFVRSLI